MNRLAIVGDSATRFTNRTMDPSLSSRLALQQLRLVGRGTESKNPVTF